MAQLNARWQKAQELMLENALDIESFAACLGKDANSLKKMVGDPDQGIEAFKSISDALARTMEQTFSKPQGWLDQGSQGEQEGGISYDLFGG